LASFLATLASFSFLVNLLFGKILLDTSPFPLVDLVKSGFFLISAKILVYKASTDLTLLASKHLDQLANYNLNLSPSDLISAIYLST